MQRYVLLALLFVGIAVAASPFGTAYDPARNYSPMGTPASTCPTHQEVKANDAAYKSTASVVKSTCLDTSYEEICAMPQGLVRCNKRDARCATSKRSNNKYYNPSIFATMTGDAEQCISEGKYVHPEASVLMPTQCVLSFIVILVCAIIVFLRAKGGCGLMATISFFSLIITCLMLLPSYFYLNGLVGAMAACIALSMYSSKESGAVAIGMLACVLAIMWFTFEDGLGFYSQNGRFNSAAANPSTEYYEQACENFYRYSYSARLSVGNDHHDGEETSSGPCVRDWLAAVYFFAVFQKICFALLAVAGANVLFAEKKEENDTDKHEEEALQESN